MPVQTRNDEMVNLLRPDFVHKTDRAYVWAQAPGLFLALPRLSGFWPMGAGYGTTAKNLVRASGLDLVPGAAVTYGNQGLAPYVTLNGSGYLLITGGNDSTYSPTGAFTAGGWFYRTSNGTLLGAWKSAGPSCWLVQAIGGAPYFFVHTGAAQFQVVGPAMSAGAWHFIACRYTPSTQLAVWMDNTKVVNTVSIPSALNPAAASFAVGAEADATAPLTGRASLCFFCETALSDIYLTALYQMTRPLFQ